MVSEVRRVRKIISLEIVLQVSTYVAGLLVILHLTQKHPFIQIRTVLIPS